MFVCRGAGAEFLVLHRSADRGGYWHPTSGALEDDEQPEDAALRELGEELDLGTGRFWPVRYEYRYPAAEEPPERRAEWPPGTEWIAVTAFIVEAPFGFEPSLNFENDGYRWCTLEQAVELFHWPDVGKALTELLRLSGR